MKNRISDKLVNWATILEENTQKQAELTSTMPFVFPHVALMPDAHLGKGSTVGSVIPTQGAVMPAAVGVDIGCGMQAVRTYFKREAFAEDLPSLQAEITRRIPMGIGPKGTNTQYTLSAEDRVRELDRSAEDDYKKYAKDWDMQLGSLGSGNHFIEAAYDEDGYVWLTIHSGSRGVGNKAADAHIKKAESLCKRWFIELPDPDLAYFVQDTDEFRAYVRDLKWAQRYARLNRDEMMDRVLQSVLQWVGSDELELPVQERFDCHHNFTEMEHHWGTNLWITRKGAVRARPGDVALIPGSMGTPSYVVEGQGSKLAFDSAPHGAGRAMGRNQAKRTISLESAREAMQGIVWGDSAALLDESPGAYKPIDQVIADAADLIEIKHVLRPIMNIKGT